MTETNRQLSLSSRLVHADDGLAAHSAVAPAMHVSTTFRYSDNPDDLQTGTFGNVCIRNPLWLLWLDEKEAD